ncbi:MAG: hypothetical protein KF749_07250 [Bacteroidetes bacterium]|nr:hypothetical protein [Bacteroidota bacterium]MCW5896568.1 hypothetical protein [Bacteroidota bacterium]
MKLFPIVPLVACTFTLIIGCSKPQETSMESPLAAKLNRFASTEITADVSQLSAGDRQALNKLIEASRLMDEIYLRQVWNGNVDLKKRLAADTSAEGKLRYRMFMLNKGPWSGLDHDSAFVEGVPYPKPAGANFYPEDITKEEFEQWVGTLSKTDQEKARGFFYTIRRDENGKLTLVPYSDEYRQWLEPAAGLLREAAALTGNTSLKSFLTKRADSFLSNDYFASDVAWMELDAPIEPTIGPYEVYMDELFNYKAAFEAFITLRNDEETSKLSKFSNELQDLENNLPIDKKYRNPKLGALAPIRVVDVVVNGGEANKGVQTAAFNLPNDEKVTKEKGSKRVMLKNVQEAKFKNILIPISNTVIAPEERHFIAFEPFFTHILAHELMHGLGPHSIAVDGTQTTVRQAMKELSSAFEEAKADISGLWALQYLIDKGVVEKSFERQMYVTFLASAFRSVRFGLNEAHGKGIALQFNYLMDEGAFVHDAASGTFSVNFDKIKQAVTKLTSEIMTIQAEGSYGKAKAMLDTYGVMRPEMKAALDKMTTIPTDIAPRYPLAEGVN